ncbi:hypothetical protein GOP47_0005388 [Adiantum capillus-veneris]|uniref:Uncharacterized protein n=1 Tax=Adiantum capillus-veneris TaxID=13818 RepID=A0A9D4V5G4_ADICA|nr:hypothetical protein GOP47_0005388 [Adiantum capillus-veneris]
MTKRDPLAHSDYLAGLTLQVQRQLQKAVDNPPQRGDILLQLFTDVALEVDDRAQELLYGPFAEARNDTTKPKVCFYEVIAERYVQVPDDGKAVFPLFLQLWSLSFSSQIFALLFHQWLFEGPVEPDSVFLRYSTAFVEGATNIFWIDVHSDTRRFFSLYHYTLEQVALKSQCLRKFPNKVQWELVLLVSRFFFFYEPVEKLGDLLYDCDAFTICSIGSAADVFVMELTDQLQKIKVEPVLIHYLQSAKSLKGLELRASTSTRLKSALYSFTAPGGPMYPTRDVRRVAWNTLDCLFPVGRNSRHLISFFFRLLHPYYWPASFWNFVLTLLAGMYNKVFYVWHWVTGTIQPQHRHD